MRVCWPVGAVVPLVAPVRRLCCLAVVLLAGSASAQSLQIRHAVTPDAPGDTEGMTRQTVATAPDREVWVGSVALDLPPRSIQTVGLELDADGQTALSLWLSDEAGGAFASLTAASVGRALAVVYDGRVLTAPVVQSAIPNGLVLITGLDSGEAERVADALRDATDGDPPPLRVDPLPPASGPSREAGLPREPAPGGSAVPREPRADPDRSRGPEAGVDGEAGRVAAAFVSAVAARRWQEVAAQLHPEALAVAQASALEILTLDQGTVIVRDGGQEGSFIASDILGAAPRAARLDALPALDVAALYLAALDVLGVWGAPAEPRPLIGQVVDGDRLHVLFRLPQPMPGVAELGVVSLARDARGEWRPLISQPQGF